MGNPRSKWSRTGAHKDRLNPMQRLYVQHYLATLNGTLAAKLAGYSPHKANMGSKQLQKRPLIRAAIDAGLAEMERTLKDKNIRAMEHTYGQATADIADLFDEEGMPLPLAKMPAKTRRAILSIEVEFDSRTEKVKDENGNEVEKVVRVPRIAKIKLHDKRASQELFAKYAGKLTERLDLRLADTLESLVPKRQSEGDGAPA